MFLLFALRVKRVSLRYSVRGIFPGSLIDGYTVRDVLALSLELAFPFLRGQVRI